MKTKSPILHVAVLLAASISVPANAQKFSQAQLDFFERNIRPVFAGKCYECHSHTGKIKGGLTLDSRDGVLAGGTSGPAIVPGDPAKSLMIRVLKGLEKDMEMPPKEEDRLTEIQIADFEKWIRMGAPDPRKAEQATAKLAVDWDKARSHWAYQPVRKPAVPTVKNAQGWVKTDVDKFVLAKLEPKGMQPSKQADRRTLARRASYTLIGLPPEISDVEDFVNDPAPDAFQKLVDKYLDSPHYGERWTRHWMDVARYADTTGDRANRRQPNYPYAWTYRNWLIEAFNKDLPYDQFIVQQIAADRLELGDDFKPLAALGFLTVGKQFMGQINEVIDDRIDVVTQGFMGMTVACARCHDHKFDPIPTKDYYSLHGVFSSTQEPELGPILSLPKDRKLFAEYLEAVEKLEDEIRQVRIKEEFKVMSVFRAKADDYLLAVHEYTTSPSAKKMNTTLFARKKTLDQNLFPNWMNYVKDATKVHNPVFAPWLAFTKLRDQQFASEGAVVARAVASGKIDNGRVNPLIAAEFKTAPRNIKEVADIYGRLLKQTSLAWQAELKKNPDAESLSGDREELRQVLFGEDSPFKLNRQGFQRLVGVRVRNLENRVRGRIADLQRTHSGSPVRAMAVQDADRPRDSYVFIRGEARNRGDRAPRQFLEILSGDDRKPFEDGSGRLDLARSISSKDNPLTARVFVNRVWQWHFGQALVKTPGDFGLRAEPPTHPKLLDWLSASFMEGGWSIKKLHRLILNSATWQQDSLRNEKYDEIDPGNDLLSRQNIQRLDFESMRDTLVVMGGKADLTVGGRSLDLDDEGEHRRTLYGYIDRANLDELFRVFDFANPDMSQAQRYNTTVPQQALFLMNSPQAIEEIRNLVNRPEMLSNATPEEKVTHLFKTTYQRIPSDEEMRLTLNFIAGKRQDKLDTPPHFAWEFGYGKYDSEGGRVLDFRPFPESSSRSSMFLPDRKVSREDVREKKARPYEVSMTGTGGAFANDTRRTLIRRWTAPVSGEIDISGELNGRSGGAEVMIAAVVSSKHGKLAEWKLTGKDQEATVKKFHVEENETIDFVVMPLKKLPIAYFNWAPTISMGEKNWKTARDFNTAARQERTGSTPLNAWERLAQVMIFGNELMYIN